MFATVPCTTQIVLPDAKPAQGSLTFTLSEPMEDTSTGELVAVVAVVVPFDPTGSIMVDLEANDGATTITASGNVAYYTVTSEIVGQPVETYMVRVPSANAGKLTELAAIRITTP